MSVPNKAELQCEW